MKKRKKTILSLERHNSSAVGGGGGEGPERWRRKSTTAWPLREAGWSRRGVEPVAWKVEKRRERFGFGLEEKHLALG